MSRRLRAAAGRTGARLTLAACGGRSAAGAGQDGAPNVPVTVESGSIESVTVA